MDLITDTQKNQAKGHRAFLKNLVLFSGTAAIGSQVKAAGLWNNRITPGMTVGQGKFLRLDRDPLLETFKPLEILSITSGRKGQVTVYDGAGNRYFSSAIDGQLFFIVGGAIGNQMALFEDGGKIVDYLVFKVN